MGLTFSLGPILTMMGGGDVNGIISEFSLWSCLFDDGWRIVG